MSDIDRIFSEKLTHWEKTPSNNAWERVDSNLSKKQKKGFIWYSVAASVCLVLLSTLFLILKDNERTARVELPKVENKPATIVSPPIKIASMDNAIQSKKPSMETVSAKKIITKDKEKVRPIIEKQDGIFNEPLTVSASEIEDINSESVVFSQEKEEVIDENKSFLITTVQPIEIIIKKGNARTVGPEQDSIEKPKSKLGRAYEQMVNLKNGEKVSLQELSNLLALHKKDKETQNKQ